MPARPIYYALVAAAWLTLAMAAYLVYQALPVKDAVLNGRFVPGRGFDYLLAGWAVGGAISAALIGGLASLVRSVGEICDRVVHRVKPPRFPVYHAPSDISVDDRRRAVGPPRIPAGWN